METCQRLPGFPRTRESIVERLIDQELLLFEGKDGGCIVHILNSGAAMIWLLCDGSRTLEEVSLEISSAESLPEDEVLSQVWEAVSQFQTLGLLEG